MQTSPSQLHFGDSSDPLSELEGDVVLLLEKYKNHPDAIRSVLQNVSTVAAQLSSPLYLTPNPSTSTFPGHDPVHGPSSLSRGPSRLSTSGMARTASNRSITMPPTTLMPLVETSNLSSADLPRAPARSTPRPPTINTWFGQEDVADRLMQTNVPTVQNSMGPPLSADHHRSQSFAPVAGMHRQYSNATSEFFDAQSSFCEGQDSQSLYSEQLGSERRQSYATSPITFRNPATKHARTLSSMSNLDPRVLASQTPSSTTQASTMPTYHSGGLDANPRYSVPLQREFSNQSLQSIHTMEDGFAYLGGQFAATGTEQHTDFMTMPVSHEDNFATYVELEGPEPVANEKRRSRRSLGVRRSSDPSSRKPRLDGVSKPKRPHRQSNKAEKASSRSGGAYSRKKTDPIPCGICDLTFRGQHEKNRHYQRTHETVKTLWRVNVNHPGFDFTTCKQCKNGKSYGADYNVAAHIRRAHATMKKSPSRNKKVVAVLPCADTTLESLRPWITSKQVSKDEYDATISGALGGEKDVDFSAEADVEDHGEDALEEEFEASAESSQQAQQQQSARQLIMDPNNSHDFVPNMRAQIQYTRSEPVVKHVSYAVSNNSVEVNKHTRRTDPVVRHDRVFTTDEAEYHGVMNVAAMQMPRSQSNPIYHSTPALSRETSRDGFIRPAPLHYDGTESPFGDEINQYFMRNLFEQFQY